MGSKKWDQFETNETLFGVKTTFNEELYTTKLLRGPQTEELEKEAARIAREIAGEDTQDLHLAEVSFFPTVNFCLLKTFTWLICLPSCLHFMFTSLHVHQERGSSIHENLGIDEETRFSSVYRGTGFDDSGYEEDEDIVLNTHNNETFGDSSGLVDQISTDFAIAKSSDGAQLSSSSFIVVVPQSIIPSMKLRSQYLNLKC